MDHQGAGRSRSAADTRRQPPWPPFDDAGGPGVPESGTETTGPMSIRSPGYGGYGTGGTGPQRVLSPGTGPQRVLGPGTGPQRLMSPGSGPSPVLHRGSGPQPVISPGSGPQPVMSPGSGPQPAPGASGAFPAAGSTGSLGRTPVRDFPPGREPAESFLGGPAENAYRDDDTGIMDPLDPADGAGEAAGPGRRRGARTKRRSRSWLAAAVAVVVAAAGFASYKFLYVPRVNAPVPSTLRLPTTAPGSGSPGFDKTLGKWQHIGTRAQDPQPLTITALYPPQFVLDGSSYVRTAASVTKTCSLAVYGADLQADLQSGHCTQVLRASYMSGDGKMMGTIGVVNLISSSAAQKAGQVTGPQEIIAPLSGKKGPTKKLGSGTGVVQAKIKGHYLILMWAEFTSLKSPSGQAQLQALEQFAANLLTGSANINLSTRMLTGKP
jgi:hypothetical protein